MAQRNQPPDRLPPEIRDHSEVVRACREWNIGRLFRVVNNLTKEPANFTVTHIGRLCGLTVSRVGEYMKDVHQVTSMGIIERIADGLRIPGERFGLAPRPWENAARPDTDEQQRLTRTTTLPSKVDEQVISHIEAILRHCQLQEDVLESRAVLPTLLGQQTLVRDLLTQCPASLRARFLSTYSNMSTSIGYYFFELNDVDRARHYHAQARAAAHDADNTELSIYALCEWSYTESWHGKVAIGIDLAAVAQSLVSKTEDPLMRVAAAQRAATAHAFDGRHKACMVELERAQGSLESARQVSTESPWYFYNEGYLTSHRSECLLRLGRPHEAAVSASAGLMLYDKSFADGYAVCTLHLGNAHLQLGEIHEAVRVISSVVGLAAQTRSARLVQELRSTRARMQPWGTLNAVKELDDHLATYGLTPNSVRQS
ncbi:MAG: hypothetical protein ACRDRH_20105 [Pseudonocardia sp.]